MGMYGQVWASMGKYGQVWASMGKYGQVWASRKMKEVEVKMKKERKNKYKKCGRDGKEKGKERRESEKIKCSNTLTKSKIFHDRGAFNFLSETV